MNYKNTFFIIGLILIVLLSVSIASATKNVTDIASNGEDNSILSDNELSDSVEVTNGDVAPSKDYAKFVAKDVTLKYDEYFNCIKIQLKDKNNKAISGENVKIIWEDSKKSNSYDDNGVYYFDFSKNVGNHKAKFVLYSSGYSAKPLTINVKIIKAPVKMTAGKWISTTKNYAVLKANVYDRHGLGVGAGAVTFKIDGKSYTVKVKYGVAIKKVRLTKAKIYNYKAIFSSKNYQTKIVSSKVFVKQAKSHYILKFGKYWAKISYKQYLKIINAKNMGKSAHVSVKTKQYFTYQVPKYKTVGVTRTKWVYKNVMSYESFYYSNGAIDSYSYDLTKYYRNGWKLYGWYDKSYSDGYESYAKLKKKVTYTDYERVQDGYTTCKQPCYITLMTVARDGQYPKGDYLDLFASEPSDSKRINLYTFNP